MLNDIESFDLNKANNVIDYQMRTASLSTNETAIIKTLFEPPIIKTHIEPPIIKTPIEPPIIKHNIEIPIIKTPIEPLIIKPKKKSFLEVAKNI